MYRVYLVLFFLFFFFKQKTAYEMRISDWSSDVCSSDLGFSPNFLLALRFDDRRDDSFADKGPVHFVCFRNSDAAIISGGAFKKIGRASCRERVCQYV